MNIPFHDHKEKILRQILGVGGGMAVAKDVGEDGAPVNLANLGQPWIDLARSAPRHALADQAPTRRHKMRQSAWTLDGTRSSHAFSVIAWLAALKYKMEKASPLPRLEDSACHVQPPRLHFLALLDRPFLQA